MRIGIYARVSTSEQQSIPMQVLQLTEYARLRGWEVVLVAEEVASGAASNRPQQAKLIEAAKKRQIDAIIVWKLDRWSRDLGALITSINEMLAFGVGFVSFTETVDFSTPQGRAMAGMIAVFANFERDVLRERVKAGIADAKRRGVRFGRPKLFADDLAERMKVLATAGLTHNEIAKQVGVGRASVHRILGPSHAPRGRPKRLRPPEATDNESGKVIACGLRNIFSGLQARLGASIAAGASLTPPVLANPPAVLRERVLQAELTDDDPSEAWEIEAEDWAEYEKSEEGIRERYQERNNLLFYSEWGTCEEYWKISPYLIERAEILKRGWTEGVISKLLGKPHFIVRHKYYSPWRFWYRSDVEALEGADVFTASLKRSHLAKENKIKSDETKLEKFKAHLQSTKLPIPDLPFPTLTKQARAAESKRRRSLKGEYFDWECEISDEGDSDELWYATKNLLHKKMQPFSKRVLDDFGVTGLNAARRELNMALEEAIQRKLLSYADFAASRQR